MNLSLVQSALARLYTDTELRQRFLADPQATGRELALSPEEAGWLASIAAEQVEFFARSLVSKRARVVAKLLSGTARTLGHDFTRLFEEYAVRPMPGGHREDACDFADWLARRPLAHPWLGDLARLEAAWLKMWRPGLKVLVVPFRHHADLVARGVRRGELPDRVGGPMLGIWVRLPGLEARFLALRLPGRP